MGPSAKLREYDSDEDIPEEETNAFKAHLAYVSRQKRIQQSQWKQFVTWVHRKVVLYNVTFGLYILDWWEVILINTIAALLLYFIIYNILRLLASTIWASTLSS
eukprot:TRINITY_DN8194_c0_g2_i1.p1 TRINITY_DN8194_c0_g2~~TRINITY_DN8194_c0_g2_i1.p1  ORF type:complete len:104 (-),score=15.82 TRINITY_DN8194_c0_g2_i1:473-784(-)